MNNKSNNTFIITNINSYENILNIASDLCNKNWIDFDSRFIIKNKNWNWCKWYCESWKNIPIICSKWHNCRNFTKSDIISHKIKKIILNETLSNIY